MALSTRMFRTLMATSVRLPAVFPRAWSSSTVDKRDLDDDEEQKPLKYLSSKADRWKAMNSFGLISEAEKEPWFQIYSVLGSVAIFLIYFCILREENDIDRQLATPINQQFPALSK